VEEEVVGEEADAEFEWDDDPEVTAPRQLAGPAPQVVGGGEGEVVGGGESSGEGEVTSQESRGAVTPESGEGVGEGEGAKAADVDEDHTTWGPIEHYTFDL
jgi:hypothetical protein